MPRIFIAIPLAVSVRAALGEVRQRNDNNFRWVAENQYHITLRFLGEVTEAELDRVQAAVRQAVVGWQERMNLSVRGLGAFPNVRRARILWAGVEGDAAALKRLHARVEAQLVGHGFASEERPFRPHITLARLRTPGPLPAYLERYREHTFGNWRVERIHVIESELSPAGPRYTVRLNVPV